MTAETLAVERLDERIESMLRAARIPGAAIGIVIGDQVIARGYGYRNLEDGLPVTPDTVFPIGSTSKAINATLLGMLVEAGQLSWDAPVQQYLPTFALADALISPKVTLRDLITMRTGLPRHDWMRMERAMTRADLLQCLRYLDISAGLRERFQYNSLTVTLSGHVAEVVTGRPWEELVRARLLEPLQMNRTGFTLPVAEPVTVSYHETQARQLCRTERLASEVTGPSGGTIHSTIEDMVRWVQFNLGHGEARGRRVLQASTLAELHSPQMLVGANEAPELSPHASYALGWFVDRYQGRLRISHGGYLHDVNSDVMLVPEERIGLVCFTNFGFPALARLLNQHAFDLIVGTTPTRTLEEKLSLYERRVVETRARLAAVPRVPNTAPSHVLASYSGSFTHPGYGAIEIEHRAGQLLFRRGRLVVPLEHWHYDAWVPEDTGIFFIHVPHAFDRSNRFLFETDASGAICAVRLPLEPAVAPIRFVKSRAGER